MNVPKIEVCRVSRGKKNQTPQQYMDKPLGERQEVLIRRQSITYTLGEKSHIETREEYIESEDRSRFYDVKVIDRPVMTVSTVVQTSKNRFGHIRLYGTQGIVQRNNNLPEIA